MKETEEKIINQLNIHESIKNIIKGTKEEISKFKEPESIKKIFKKAEFIENIFKEIRENNDLSQSNELESILSKVEEKLLRESNTSESIKKIFKEVKENNNLNKSIEPESIKNILSIIKEKILSQSNTPESIKNIFKEAKKRINKKKYLSLLVFDGLGLSEKSPTNCLKVLHSKLEMSLDPEDKKQISFIGISNWRLDAAKQYF